MKYNLRPVLMSVTNDTSDDFAISMAIVGEDEEGKLYRTWSHYYWWSHSDRGVVREHWSC